jgi:hypothetical protein
MIVLMKSRNRALQILTVVVVAAVAGVPAAADAKTPSTVRRSERPVPNILGGTTAVGTSLGMVARITYSTADGVETCSGTVVSSDVILTAGHCAEDEDTGVVHSAAGYQVLTGTQSLISPGQISGVTAVIPYPTFDPSTLSGDAALLVLATPTTVAPVALASDPADIYYYDGGTATAITGWGIYDSYGDLPDDLQYGYSAVQSASYCAQRTETGGTPFDSLFQLCAIDAPSDADGACKGDSGGPLLVSVNHAWLEIGITSFGDPDCNTAKAGYFTRVDRINSWIESEIRSYPPLEAAPPPAATPTPAPTPAPAPAPTPAPTPSPAPVSAPPQPGAYTGGTSQNQMFSLEVNQSRTSISKLFFGFRLRCTRHRRITYTDAPGLTRHLSLENGMGFDARFHDRTGTQYRLAGTFSSSGQAHGTLSITWRAARYGNCTSGPVRWSALR